jgi:hypothetical protein
MEVAAFRHFNHHLACPLMEFNQKVNFVSKREEAHYMLMHIEYIKKVDINIEWGRSG